MRHTALVFALALAAPAALQAQSTMEIAPSGRGRSEVTLTPARGQQGAPATIVLDYGQPHLRGRSLHTDSLVPYGQPWRTGANSSTTLTTGVPLTIGGVNVDAGRYIVMTLPTREGWTLILQRDAGQGPMEYSAANDVARIPLRRRELRDPVESLTMWLIPALGSPPRGELRIRWGTVEVSADWRVASGEA